MADLHEAAKLCPNNREIRRLLARVEEECKQMQRTQNKLPQLGAATPFSQASGGHSSDQEADDGQEEPSEHSSARSFEDHKETLEEEDEEEEEEEQQERRGEASWPPSIYSLNRAEAPRPTSPPGGPSRLPPHRYPREHVAQHGLVLQPTKQAQIVKTKQHLSSMQAGGRPTGTRAPYAPSSPLPSRHMSSALKPGPGIDISPLAPPADEYGDRASPAAVSVDQHCGPSYPACSQGQQRLSAHSVSSLDGPLCSQGNHVDVGREESCAGGGIRVSSSTSSLASSSSLSDSGKLGPDVRTKTSDKAKHGQQGGAAAAAAEYKPRPFMGVMDKTARFLQLQQQQQQQQTLHGPVGRSWQAHSCEGVATLGLQPSSELPYAKTASTYHEQHKPPLPQGAMAMGSLHNGMLAKEFTEKFCQAATCYKESKPALAMPHTFIDSKPKQAGLTRDNPAINVASMKPKRSFIESNV